jgi:hypothetical protein
LKGKGARNNDNNDGKRILWDTLNMPVNDEHFAYINIFVGMEFLLAIPFH